MPNKDVKLSKALNTTPFVAPEVFLGTYSKRIDEFAVGVLMYYLLSGYVFPYIHPKCYD
jgi:serine/threonine protein kinase